MSYTKQNFKSKATLYASQLNAMDNQIAANETAIEGKQPKGNYLTEHQKIKTINGQSLVGTGNIVIEGGSVSAEEPLKIVYIGNSFSLNSTEHIYAILEELGHKDFSVDIAMISGSSLQDHLANLKGDLANYAHYHTTKAGRATLGQKTLHDILTYDNWKYIMLQQKSATSDDATTYEDVYEILNYCKKYCPGAKFGWHMGWENVGAVYGNIVNAVKSTILKSAFFDFIIPNGTVIENAKTSKVDIAKIMSTDDLHLSGEHPFGKYTATLGTIKSIFRENVDINTITYKSTLTDEEAAIAKESVMNAYLRPFEVTQSVYVNSSALCTFVINPTPSNAVVTIDGVNRTSVSVAEGTVVAWKVEADGYVTQSGNYTVTDNYTMSVALEEAQPSTGEYEYELYQGFYNETTKAANAGVAAANTKWVCTEVFTRDMLPIGSQVILGEGFQLRHNRWTNDTDLEAERGTLYQKATTIHITEDYWGNYTYMAFSLAYSNGTTVISPTTDETLIREALKIIISA